MSWGSNPPNLINPLTMPLPRSASNGLVILSNFRVDPVITSRSDQGPSWWSRSGRAWTCARWRRRPTRSSRRRTCWWSSRSGSHPSLSLPTPPMLSLLSPPSLFFLYLYLYHYFCPQSLHLTLHPVHQHVHLPHQVSQPLSTSHAMVPDAERPTLLTSLFWLLADLSGHYRRRCACVLPREFLWTYWRDLAALSPSSAVLWTTNQLQGAPKWSPGRKRNSRPAEGLMFWRNGCR